MRLVEGKRVVGDETVPRSGDGLEPAEGFEGEQGEDARKYEVLRESDSYRYGLLCSWLLQWRSHDASKIKGEHKEQKFCDHGQIYKEATDCYDSTSPSSSTVRVPRFFKARLNLEISSFFENHSLFL